MRERPVIAAMLDTGDSFLHLERQEISEETVRELGYRDTTDIQAYNDYMDAALRSRTEEHLPNYHSVAETLVEQPSLLYEQDLLRPETEQQADSRMEELRGTAGRSLNAPELEAITQKAMKDTQAFPRRAIDKEELLDRLHIGLYSGEKAPASASRYEPVA